jgi:hypothetical protein
MLYFLQKHTGGLSSVAADMRTLLANAVLDVKAEYDLAWGFRQLLGGKAVQPDPQKLKEDIDAFNIAQKWVVLNAAIYKGVTITLDEYADLRDYFVEEKYAR